VGNGSVEVLKIIKGLLPQVGRSLEGRWGSEPLVQHEYYFRQVRDVYTHLSLNVGIHLGDENPLKLIGRKKRFHKRLAEIATLTKSLDIPVIAWTVNRDKKIRKILNYEFDYLLTDQRSP
jgi:glycerophosphoryl diester phosphodiesterase